MERAIYLPLRIRQDICSDISFKSFIFIVGYLILSNYYLKK